MAAETFKTRDGKPVKAGAKAKLTLQHGEGEREVTGTIRAFAPNDEQIAELEARLATLRADNGLRWEIETGDPEYPAVGFLPENVLKSGS